MKTLEEILYKKKIISDGIILFKNINIGIEYRRMRYIQVDDQQHIINRNNPKKRQIENTRRKLDAPIFFKRMLPIKKPERIKKRFTPDQSMNVSFIKNRSTTFKLARSITPY